VGVLLFANVVEWLAEAADAASAGNRI
jgi:hypothetical protein